MTPHSDNPTPALVPFDFQPRTRLIFGVKSVEGIGELAAELGARKVLLVTDPGIMAAGHAERVVSLLERARLTVSFFSEVQENPGTICVEKCVEAARRSSIDTLIAVGGGSSMDTAKGCNFILTNGGRMADYWGIGKATKPMLPFIAIPTTAGTGSECQSFALITDEHTHQKMACGDPKAAARIAVLDPELTLSQPPRVTAGTGIDAIAHALETAVTTRRNPVSSIFSREAFRLTIHAIARVINSPNDLEARGAMLLGAAWAGTAIENSMLGAAHSAANPLTAQFGIAHGHAVGLMLPHVIRFNAENPAAGQGYAELAHAAGFLDVRVDCAALLLAERLENLMDVAGVSRSLRSFGAAERDIPRLAGEAARQWTAQFNPRPVRAADFEQLYAAALSASTRAGTVSKAPSRRRRPKRHRQLQEP